MSPEAPLPLGDLTRWGLDPDVIHLNHGSWAATPTAVIDAAEALRREVERDPLDFYDRRWDPLLDQVLTDVESFLGAPAGTTSLVANATEGVDLALATLRLGEGDIAVVTDHGYPAADANLDQRGVTRRTVRIPLGTSDDELVGKVADALVGADVLVVDHISSLSGRVAPVGRLAQVARAAEVPIVVDGAHVPGHLPVDLRSLGVDFWVGNFHKWACAPKASAAFYAAERWHDRIPAPTPSSNTAQRPAYPGNVRWQGTRDVGAWGVLHDVLQLSRWWLTDEIRGRNVALAERGAQLVADAIGSQVVEHPHAQMTLVPLQREGDGTNAWELRRRAADEAGIAIGVTVLRGELHLRLSAHVYNRAEDYAAVAERLPELLDRWRSPSPEDRP